jgi:hypothetical protein
LIRATLWELDRARLDAGSHDLEFVELKVRRKDIDHTAEIKIIHRIRLDSLLDLFYLGGWYDNLTDFGPLQGRHIRRFRRSAC